MSWHLGVRTLCVEEDDTDVHRTDRSGCLGLWLQRWRPAWRGPWWGVSLLALATAAFSSPRISLVVTIFMAFLSAWSFFTAPILPPPPHAWAIRRRIDIRSPCLQSLAPIPLLLTLPSLATTLGETGDRRPPAFHVPNL